MLRVQRGGTYYRVADPAWHDPLDGAYAAIYGGRWTAPGSHATVYLNATLGVARANVNHNFAGLPYRPEDLDPAAAPLLIDVTVTPDHFLDVTGPAGAEAVGLPSSYPRTTDGVLVTWERCQAVGQRAHDANLPGIACLSARANGEELAHFNRGTGLAAARSRSFDSWFWPRTQTSA